MSSSRGRETLYKYKGKTRGVDVRVKDKRLDAKKKREELLSNRRGVLVDINDEENKDKTKVEGIKHSERTNKRREELIKWKQERDERKKQEKSKSKPAFIPSGSFKLETTSTSSLTSSVHSLNTTISSNNNNTRTISSNNSSITSVETKLTTRKSSRIATRSQKEVEPKSIPTSKVSKSKTAVVTTTTKSMSKKKPVKVANPPPLKSHDDHVTSKRSTRSKDTTSSKEHTSSLSNDVTVSNEKENIISSNNSAHTHGKGVSQLITAAWIPGATVATPSKGGVVPDFKKAFVKECFSPFQFGTSTSSRKTEFTFRKEISSAIKKPLKVPELYDSMEEGVASTITPPTSPNKGDINKESSTHSKKSHDHKGEKDNEEEEEEENDYYKGHSDDSIEAINISVAHNNDYTNQQLQKECSNKINEEEEEMVIITSTRNAPPPGVSSDESGNITSPDLPIKDTPLAPPIITPTSGCSSNYVTPPTHIASPANITSPDFITPPTMSNEVTSTVTSGEKGHDLKPFYERHEEVTLRFNDLCQEWNDKLEILEEQDIRPDDEVIDDIRTTVCQAQLLMRQKLKQYIDLVKLAENPTAEQRTEPEDLQGFWDMVYFQVENIDNKFNFFKEMEANNWTTPVAADTKTINNKPRRSKRRASEVAKSKLSSKKTTAATAPPPSERQLAARAKREAARSKLRALKMAAAASRGKEEKEEDNEPPAPKTPKHDNNNTTDLISFSPAVTSSSLPPSGCKTPKTKSSTKKKRKTPHRSSILPEIQLSEVEEMQGAFVTKLVHINASKKMLNKLDTNAIMSPARRSKRLLDIQGHQEQIVVNSLLELPSEYHDQCTYQDNSALL